MYRSRNHGIKQSVWNLYLCEMWKKEINGTFLSEIFQELGEK